MAKIITIMLSSELPAYYQNSLLTYNGYLPLYTVTHGVGHIAYCMSVVGADDHEKASKLSIEIARRFKRPSIQWSPAASRQAKLDSISLATKMDGDGITCGDGVCTVGDWKPRQ